MVIYSFAILFQFLDIFGVAVEVNKFYWKYIVFLLGHKLIDLAFIIIEYLTYDKAKMLAESDTETADNVASAAVIQKLVKRDVILFVATNAIFYGTLAFHR